jgi:hypothetical protein
METATANGGVGAGGVNLGNAGVGVDWGRAIETEAVVDDWDTDLGQKM